MQFNFQLTPGQQTHDAGVVMNAIFNAVAKQVFVEINHVTGDMKIKELPTETALTPTEQATLMQTVRDLPVYVSG